MKFTLLQPMLSCEHDLTWKWLSVMELKRALFLEGKNTSWDMFTLSGDGDYVTRTKAVTTRWEVWPWNLLQFGISKEGHRSVKEGSACCCYGCSHVHDGWFGGLLMLSNRSSRRHLHLRILPAVSGGLSSKLYTIHSYSLIKEQR